MINPGKPKSNLNPLSLATLELEQEQQCLLDPDAVTIVFESDFLDETEIQEITVLEELEIHKVTDSEELEMINKITELRSSVTNEEQIIRPQSPSLQELEVTQSSQQMHPQAIEQDEMLKYFTEAALIQLQESNIRFFLNKIIFFVQQSYFSRTENSKSYNKNYLIYEYIEADYVAAALALTESKSISEIIISDLIKNLLWKIICDSNDSEIFKYVLKIAISSNVDLQVLHNLASHTKHVDFFCDVVDILSRNGVKRDFVTLYTMAVSLDQISKSDIDFNCEKYSKIESTYDFFSVLKIIKVLYAHKLHEVLKKYIDLLMSNPYDLVKNLNDSDCCGLELLKQFNEAYQTLAACAPDLLKKIMSVKNFVGNGCIDVRNILLRYALNPKYVWSNDKDVLVDNLCDFLEAIHKTFLLLKPSYPDLACSILERSSAILRMCDDHVQYFDALPKFMERLKTCQLFFSLYKDKMIASEYLHEEIGKNITFFKSDFKYFNAQISGVTNNGLLQTWNRFVKDEYSKVKNSDAIIKTETKVTQKIESSKKLLLLKYN